LNQISLRSGFRSSGFFGFSLRWGGELLLYSWRELYSEPRTISYHGCVCVSSPCSLPGRRFRAGAPTPRSRRHPAAEVRAVPRRIDGHVRPEKLTSRENILRAELAPSVAARQGFGQLLYKAGRMWAMFKCRPAGLKPESRGDKTWIDAARLDFRDSAAPASKWWAFSKTRAARSPNGASIQSMPHRSETARRRHPRRAGSRPSHAHPPRFLRSPRPSSRKDRSIVF